MKMHVRYWSDGNYYEFTTPEEFAEILTSYKSWALAGDADNDGGWNEQTALEVYGECIEIGENIIQMYKDAEKNLECAALLIVKSIEKEKTKKRCTHCESATCVGRFERTK